MGEGWGVEEGDRGNSDLIGLEKIINLIIIIVIIIINRRSH